MVPLVLVHRLFVFGSYEMLSLLADVMVAVRMRKAENRSLAVAFRIARDRRRRTPAWGR